MNNDCVRKAFAFLSYKTANSKEANTKEIFDPKFWDKQDKQSSKYMLSYVAKRIDCDDPNKSICTCWNLKKEFILSERFFSKNLELKETYFSISNVKCFMFATKIVIFSIELDFSNADYDTLSSILYEIKQQKAPLISSKSGVAFNPKNYIDNLICTTGMNELKNYDSYSNDSYQRINILTYYETENKEDIDDQIMFRLSHIYNNNFIYSADTDDKFKVYKNNTVCTWGVTAEACACISYLNGNNNFTRNVFRNNFDQYYLLMYAMVLHQKFNLYSILEEFGTVLTAKESDSYESAEKYRDSFYRFKQDYNFHIISEVTQYQNVYDLMYKAMSIDDILNDVKEPLDAINTILSEKHEKAERTSDKKTESALTVLSIFAVFSALIDSWDFLTNIKDIIFHHSTWHGNWAQVICSAAIILVFLIMIWRMLSNKFNSKSNR